jgi:cell division protein FtsN
VAEETTQIALAESASPVEDTTPAETAQAGTAVKQPIMPVARQGDWVINLASYTWKSTANKKLALFKDKGVDAEVFRVIINDKPMYRVRVTGFASSRAARAEVASIEQTLDLEGAWVARR